DQLTLANSIRAQQLADLGIAATDAELDMHYRIFAGETEASDIHAVHDWLHLLSRQNREKKIYKRHLFDQLLRQRWRSYLLKYPAAMRKHFGLFITSTFSNPFTKVFYTTVLAVLTSRTK